MKKRYWIVLITCVCIVLVLYFIFSPTSPVQNIISPYPEQGENETEGPSFPEITFPWSSGESSSGGEGGAGGSGGEGSAGAAGGGGDEEEIEQLVRYTLYIESEPSNLSVFVKYSIDGNVFNITEEAPYSLVVDGDSAACVLASGLKGSGTLKWTKDSENCLTTECHSPFFGCEVLMDSDHIVTEHWIANWTE